MTARRTSLVCVLSLAAGAALAAPGANAGPAARPVPGAEKPLAQRIADRTFPSVFQAWNPADNLKGEDRLVTAARHDLLFHGTGFFGLSWEGQSTGLATSFRPDSVTRGLQRRSHLLELNPNMVLLAEVRYRDAGRGFLPEGHKWWMRKNGKVLPGWEEGGFFRLDYANPEYRAHVAARCKAVVQTGVVDGVMLDWWSDDDDHLALIKAVRAAVGERALILVNANDRTTPRTAAYVNGYFMECCSSRTAKDWHRIAETLAWAQERLRRPHVNCLETWYHKSRRDEGLMRATTTLSLTHSDGYCLFSDPNPLKTPDHLHDWYAFWERSLGRPAGPGTRRPDGATQREFDNGTAVYNPMGNKAVTVTFAEVRRSLATGRSARAHVVAPADGDIFLRQGKGSTGSAQRAAPPR